MEDKGGGFLVVVFGLVALAAYLVLRDTVDKGPWIEVPRTAAPAPPMILEGGVERRPEVGRGCSAFIAHGIVNVPLGGMLVAAAALALVHRRRARAQAAFDPRAPLRDGAAVVFGEVEPLPGHEGPAVEARIKQRGTESRGKRGGVTHSWDEIRREVRAHPFYLRREDGTRVRVEPDERVALHDDLTRITADGPNTRTRIAELTAGERVHIFGQLRGASTIGARDTAYRDGARGPVLTSPPLGRMVISTERPGDTEAKRMRFHARWAVALAIAFVILAGVVMPTYELLAFDGEQVSAEVDGIRTWKVWVHPKNQRAYQVQHYAVRARLPAPGGGLVSLEDECSSAFHACVKRGDCTHAPFVVSRHAPSFHALGFRPTLSVGRAILLVLVMVILGVVYPTSVIATRPWYMQSGVKDWGTGPLDHSKP